MIEIRNLYKYYGDRRAVGPLSTEIESGEVVGLLGLNGAGKTTTLRILACDLLPTSGTVAVDGVDVVEQPERVRAATGYLPDLPPLYGEMTVREYLRFAAALRGVSARDITKRVREAEKRTGVHRVRNQVIASLSHGFRQRLGIAQAIVHRPRLVVLDEPSSGLDPVQIVEMRRLIRELGGDHTVVVSSHILSEISETCDRILMIRDGEIWAAGTEQQLVDRYLSGMQVDVVLRRPSEHPREQIELLLISIDGVHAVSPLRENETEPGIDSFRVSSGSDVRAEICRVLVGAGAGVLELTRSQRELESVFLQLSQPDSTPADVEADATASPDSGHNEEAQA